MVFSLHQGGISNILEELVVQPLLVSISALTLATETVRSILKIDDVVSGARTRAHDVLNMTEVGSMAGSICDLNTLLMLLFLCR